MIFDFEDLEKRCRRYRLKKYLLPALLLLLVGGVAGYLLLPSLRSTFTSSQASSSLSTSSAISSSLATSSVASSSTKMAHSSSSLVKKPKRCYAIQLFYGYDRYIDKLLEHNEKAKKIGFSCYVKRGRMLSNGNRQLFLVCNVQKTKKALRPWIDLAKRSGLDYTIVRDDCTHLSHATPPTKPKAKPKQKAASHSSTPQVVLAKEPSTHQLEKLFAQRHSYDLAIQIARSYYNSGQYKKALRWAKKANALDREQEDAWILYAKSLKKMGEDAKARQILRVYLDYKESSKARKLLKEWQ